MGGEGAEFTVQKRAKVVNAVKGHLRMIAQFPPSVLVESADQADQAAVVVAELPDVVGLHGSQPHGSRVVRSFGEHVLIFLIGGLRENGRKRRAGLLGENPAGIAVGFEFNFSAGNLRRKTMETAHLNGLGVGGGNVAADPLQHDGNFS